VLRFDEWYFAASDTATYKEQNLSKTGLEGWLITVCKSRTSLRREFPTFKLIENDGKPSLYFD
jgi:hypothetical protein